MERYGFAPPPRMPEEIRAAHWYFRSYYLIGDEEGNYTWLKVCGPRLKAVRNLMIEYFLYYLAIVACTTTFAFVDSDMSASKVEVLPLSVWAGSLAWVIFMSKGFMTRIAVQLRFRRHGRFRFGKDFEWLQHVWEIDRLLSEIADGNADLSYDQLRLYGHACTQIADIYTGRLTGERSYPKPKYLMANVKTLRQRIAAE